MWSSLHAPSFGEGGTGAADRHFGTAAQAIGEIVHRYDANVGSSALGNLPVYVESVFHWLYLEQLRCSFALCSVVHQHPLAKFQSAAQRSTTGQLESPTGLLLAPRTMPFC